MKLGQMTSYADLVLDAPERELLATLHTQLRPMSRADVVRIFVEDLGKTPRQVFAAWSPEPFATASIGQVHAARLHDGRAVAVKVQYPRIADALKIDLAHAAVIDRALALMFRGPQRAVIFDEMRRRFIDECDYLLEAENQRELARLFSGHASIRIARVIDELTTRRILVSELLEGVSLDSFANTADIDARNRAAIAIVDFYSEAMHRHRLYNTDPNPGNFLFGDLHTSFLDFGRVQHTSSRFSVQLNRVVRAVLERDRSAFRAILIEMGIVADPAQYDFEHSYRFMLCVHRASLCDEPFAFTTDHLRHMWRAFVDRNPNLSRIRLAPEMVFLHQYYFGVTAILVRLGAKISYRAKLLDLLYRDDEPRPSPYTEPELRALDL
jgi:predicted unusual protein kinase regulating ubiquinone biosynthesis (AarF/ABC1/UbiB family)